MSNKYLVVENIWLGFLLKEKHILYIDLCQFKNILFKREKMIKDGRNEDLRSLI